MAKHGPRLDEQRREQFGGAFATGGAHYDRVRPEYPQAAADFLVPDTAHDVLDAGAGTGKFTASLVNRGFSTLPGTSLMALDPSADMLAQLSKRFPQVPTHVGTAEATGLTDSSLDAVTFAQAWHWVDPEAGSREMARILRPGGTLGLIWNQMDTSVPWVKRLTRIMHAGDVIRPDFVPRLGPDFTALERFTETWADELTPAGIMALTRSRSYYLRASEAVREKVMANLRWYLHDFLGHHPDELITLPYVTYAWRAVTH